MNTALASMVCIVFLVLALWHVHMAIGARRSSSESGAVPTVGGRPLFVPSRKATLAVAVILALFAGLVAATAGLVSLGLPPIVLVGLSYGLALGLLARAVGEFKYVGFFKRVRGSRFATLDTFVYSPLCLLLAAGVAAVAARHGA
jgi:hypothetical protein